MNDQLKASSNIPVHLIKLLLPIAQDSLFSQMLVTDEYMFSAYFAAIFQVIKNNTENPEDEIINCIKKAFPEINERHIDFSNTSDDSLEHREKLTSIVHDLRAQFREDVTLTYVNDFFIGSTIYKLLINEYGGGVSQLSEKIGLFFSEMIPEKINNLTLNTSIKCNISYLKSIINQNRIEDRLIETTLLFSIDVRSVIFRNLFLTIIKSSHLHELFYKTIIRNAHGLNDFDQVFSSADVDEVLSSKNKLNMLGIINYDQKTKRLGQFSEFWTFTLANYAETIEKFYDRFVIQIKTKKTTFSGAIASVEKTDENILEDLIEKFLYPVKKSEELAEGFNILMYGNNRLDKIGYIYKLINGYGSNCVGVRTKDARTSDIPGICYIAQRWIADNDKATEETSVLIIERAEDALSKRRSTPSWYVMLNSDGELNEAEKDDLDSDELLLIKNPVPTIWLTSSPTSITPENVGRFLCHIEFRGASRADRRLEIEKAITSLNLSDDLGIKLARYCELNIEQIKSASRSVEIIGAKQPEAETILIKLIENSQKALERNKVEDIRDSVTTYNLDYLNLAGNMPIDKIILALQKKQKGTMCFYGPPGTGKTQLAEYIATQVDKPLIVKAASDILSMWLGENEKNIAKAFEEAKSEDAILLIDEADSFLRDRAMATKSWEVTQVNELLQRMERFPGIFICATNLFSSIDAAALRRFTFKLEFRPLTVQQRINMLMTEVGAKWEDFSHDHQESLEMELAMIKYLTPGDFATVKRQCIMLDETLTINTWIKRLQVESDAKSVGLQRNTYNTDHDVNGKLRGE